MDDRTRPISKSAIRKIKKAVEPGKPWDADKFGSTLFEQTGECVFIIGMDLRYLAANRQALNLLGYEETDLVGMSVSDVMFMEEMPASNWGALSVTAPLPAVSLGASVTVPPAGAMIDSGFRSHSALGGVASDPPTTNKVAV